MEDYLNHHTNINYNLSNPGVIVGRASRTLIVGTQNNHIMRNENNVKREVHSDLPKFPVFSIPFPSNPNFSGRCDILRTLDEKIRSVAPTATSEEQHLRSCLVYGIAGVGKTQVALKYCYRYKASYDAIFWLQAESKGKLFHDALEMQRKLQLSKEENKDTIVETLQHWLQVTKNKWLLVFDNAECWGTLEPLIPRTAHGSVIITSQHDMFGDMTTSNIHLRPLNKFEGGALLAKHLGNHGHHTDDQNDINLLCDELGGLPLAIAQIAGYITQSKSSVTAVLAKFQKRSSMAKIFDGFTGVPALQYNRTLSNVWDVALQELDEPAQTVLQVLSMLDADGVPHSLLFGDHGCAQLLELKDSERAIATLATRQLVTISKNKGEKTYSTHRALQKSVQLRLDGNGKFQHIFQIACGLVRRKFPRQSPTQLPQNDKWNVCEQLSPHIMSLRNVYEASDKKDQLLSIEFAQLLGDVANYFWERNLTVTGLEACETAERICDGLTGKFLSERAEIYILGVGLREYHGISDREASRYRCEKSLALRQEYINNLPPANASKVDVENYANAWHNLSCILMEYGFYEEALQYQGLAISIRNTNGESNEIANAQSELYRSLCLTVLGKHSQALKVAESLEVMIEELPNEEKNMLSVALIQFQFHLAEVYFATGRVETALEKMQKVSELRGQYFGFKGATLDAYYMLGVMEWRRENIDEAE
ncbi:P-loop containing nucleoside triphosphate hydrolase protein [Hypoxylon trugodes]|uniref:P-loop containing nucleoside triphosphate hydrolase protein n=1 Tax=Hypoxylon trugodes TaxID=326681 RepID=UPI0021A0E8C1|nr:P-loop containing nucleoside triphosphate hydrolase protein [Hypoxylon trugodes]KAI1392901.1 P-loop containing nucleoside triphosphate hydrolase protein [Hypoxylon trugodes]